MLDFIIPGIALVVVLALLAIIHIWILVFFMSVAAYLPVLFKSKAKPQSPDEA